VAVLSKSIELAFSRISSPRPAPSDILGSEILDQRTNEFHVHKGRSSRTSSWPMRSTARTQLVQSAASGACRSGR